MKDIILVGLDRDNTINYDEGFFGKDENWKEQLKIYPYVIEGIKKLKEKSNVKIIVATNQGGVALGHLSLERVEEVNKEINNIFKKENIIIDGWYNCPYADPKYTKEKGLTLKKKWVKNTELRKPGIGMLKKASNDLGIPLNKAKVYFIGDKVTDVLTGINANGKGILINTHENEKHQKQTKEIIKEYNGRVFIADNFLEAVNIILEDINL